MNIRCFPISALSAQRFSAFRRIASPFLTVAAAVVFQGVAVQTASAHSLTVMATSSCSGGSAVISYTVTSWDLVDIGGTNPTITVSFNGVVVDTEPFSLSTMHPNQFSGTKPAPATASVTVEAIAVGTWGDGFAPGETNSVIVAVPTNCASPSPVSKGDTATIGFWHNKNGQAVIDSFNGGSTATMLGNWLATNFPRLFDVSNPYTGTSLAALTNADVASVYLNLWSPSGVTKNTYVQAFAVALACYATSTNLGANSTTASFGFNSSPGGTCDETFNVGSNGAAFGVPNGTTLTVSQVLAAANANFNPTTGLFYGGDQTLTSDLNNVLDGINSAGDI